MSHFKIMPSLDDVSLPVARVDQLTVGEQDTPTVRVYRASPTRITLQLRKGTRAHTINIDRDTAEAIAFALANCIDGTDGGPSNRTRIAHALDLAAATVELDTGNGVTKQPALGEGFGFAKGRVDHDAIAKHCRLTLALAAGWE